MNDNTTDGTVSGTSTVGPWNPTGYGPPCCCRCCKCYSCCPRQSAFVYPTPPWTIKCNNKTS